MKYFLYLSASVLFLCASSSCSLLGSALKLPASAAQTVGRTLGVNQLTDDAPDPVEDEAIKPSSDSSEE